MDSFLFCMQVVEYASIKKLAKNHSRKSYSQNIYFLTELQN